MCVSVPQTGSQPFLTARQFPQQAEQGLCPYQSHSRAEPRTLEHDEVRDTVTASGWGDCGRKNIQRIKTAEASLPLSPPRFCSLVIIFLPHDFQSG